MLPAIRASLPTCCNFTSAQLYRQQHIVAAVEQFLKNLLEKQTVSANEVYAFAQSVLSWITLNIKEATMALLDL